MEDRGVIQPGPVPNSLPLGAQENFGAVKTQATPNQAPVGHVGGLKEPAGSWTNFQAPPGATVGGGADPAGTGYGGVNIGSPAGGSFGLVAPGGGWSAQQENYGDVNIASTVISPVAGPDGT